MIGILFDLLLIKLSAPSKAEKARQLQQGQRRCNDVFIPFEDSGLRHRQDCPPPQSPLEHDVSDFGDWGEF